MEKRSVLMERDASKIRMLTTGQKKTHLTEVGILLSRFIEHEEKGDDCFFSRLRVILHDHRTNL